MVQNKLIFFYCLFVFIGLIHALPRSATIKNRNLVPSLTKREDCFADDIVCGGVCCDPIDCIKIGGEDICDDDY